jgi:arsenite methyltransferase
LKTNNGSGTECRITRGTAIYGNIRNVAGPAIRPGGLCLTDRAVSLCSLGANSRVLDVGCGTGATVVHLRKKYHFSALALDITASLIDKAGAFPFVQGDALRLPFRDGEMDGIICECVISVLERPDLAFAEFVRVLRPEGYMMVSDLYDRGVDTVYAADRPGDAGCSRNLRSRAATEKLVIDNGFEPVLWEDHTGYMKELAAQLILGGLSADDLGKSVGLAGADALRKSCSAPLRPGYYLLVARKNS